MENIINQILEISKTIQWPGALIIVAMILGFCYILGKIVEK